MYPAALLHLVDALASSLLHHQHTLLQARTAYLDAAKALSKCAQKLNLPPFLPLANQLKRLSSAIKAQLAQPLRIALTKAELQHPLIQQPLKEHFQHIQAFYATLQKDQEQLLSCLAKHQPMEAAQRAYTATVSLCNAEWKDTLHALTLAHHNALTQHQQMQTLLASLSAQAPSLLSIFQEPLPPPPPFPTPPIFPLSSQVAIFLQSQPHQQCLSCEKLLEGKEQTYDSIPPMDKLSILLCSRSLLPTPIDERILTHRDYSLFLLACLEDKLPLSLPSSRFFFMLNVCRVLCRGAESDSLLRVLRVSNQIVLARRKPLLLLRQLSEEIRSAFDATLLRQLLLCLGERNTPRKKQKLFSSLRRGLFGTEKAAEKTTNSDTALRQLVFLTRQLDLPSLLPFIKSVAQRPLYEQFKKELLLFQDGRGRKSLQQEKARRRERQWKKGATGSYCLAIVAKRGFLGREGWELRLVCKALRQVHILIAASVECQAKEKWVRLVGSTSRTDYIAMKQEVAQGSAPSATEEIITLDVHRSLHLHGEKLNPTVLHSLLRTYAFYHQEVNYCQGMNYVAGYFYLRVHDEHMSYLLFQWAMERFLKNTFADQFVQLKCRVHQLQRLLWVFQPALAQHFGNQNLSAQCYVVPWLITLFSTTYQYTFSSHVVDCLWDRFLAFGWREFFRFVMWLFSVERDFLLRSPYDAILHHFADLTRSPLFLANTALFRTSFTHLIDPKLAMRDIQITDSLLSSYQEQFMRDFR